MNEIIRIICSKYDAQEATTSTIFDLAANTATTLSVDIPQGFIFYLLEYGGNSTSSDTAFSVRNSQGLILISFSEFPDFFHIFDYIPFLKDPLKLKYSYKFTNNASTTCTITFISKGILVPEVSEEKFKKDLMDYFSLPKLLGCTPTEDN